MTHPGGAAPATWERFRAALHTLARLRVDPRLHHPSRTAESIILLADDGDVTLTRGFWIAKYETTQSEWKRIVGPFPAPRPPRRRLVVDDARMRPMYVDPEEAAGIEILAQQCELSLSELVTIAIDSFYGP